MDELPYPWNTYAHIQERLAGRTFLDGHTWGLEAGLNRLLAETPCTAEQRERTIRSEGRKERHRAVLRRIHVATQEVAESPENIVDARERMRRAAGLVVPENWALLRAVGEGYEYKEIAGITGVSVGTLRARVLRLRRDLRVPSSGNGQVA